MKNSLGKMEWQPVLQAFDEEAEVDVYERNLPHWRQNGATYFVTWRLADALPQAKLLEIKLQRARWRQRSEVSGLPVEARRIAYSVWFSQRIEELLAAGLGSCCLQGDEAGKLVEKSLLHFQGDRYYLDSYVVMPNHVHLLVTPHADWELSSIVHSWKSYTAHRLSTLFQRKGLLWQDEYFDHIVRDECELDGYRRYIVDNPVAADLPAGSYRVDIACMAALVGCTGETPVPRESTL